MFTFPTLWLIQTSLKPRDCNKYIIGGLCFISKYLHIASYTAFTYLVLLNCTTFNQYLITITALIAFNEVPPNSSFIKLFCVWHVTPESFLQNLKCLFFLINVYHKNPKPVVHNWVLVKLVFKKIKFVFYSHTGKSYYLFTF